MTEPEIMRGRLAEPEAPAALILASLDDLEAVEALCLPVGVATAGPDGFLVSGRPVAADRVHLAALGVVVLSRDAAAALETLWTARFGTALPGKIDLTDVADGARREAALVWIAGRLVAQRREFAVRMVGALRDMAVLRQEHEAMQTAFARLEAHAWQYRLSERKLSHALPPVEGSPILELPSGGAVVQRIAGGSVGFSDVAIRIAELPQPRQGVLTCRLESPDLGSVIAEWTIPAARMQSGWLRLSLARGLAEDPVGLLLRLDWTGAMPLRLATAMAHPDPRFRPATAGGAEAGRHVLAMEVWHHLPGVRAPATAKGWLPDDALEAQSPLRRVEGRDLLQAINLETLVRDMGRVEGGDALLVHVVPDRVACAILPEVVSGVRQISVDVLTAHAKGPVVDYAVAVLPSDLRPRQPGALPDFPDEYHSGWVRQKPMRAGQVTLILPDLPGTAHDLYLMTRLAPGVSSNAYGWSGFSGLVLHV